MPAAPAQTRTRPAARRPHSLLTAGALIAAVGGCGRPTVRPEAAPASPKSATAARHDAGPRRVDAAARLPSTESRRRERVIELGRSIQDRPVNLHMFDGAGPVVLVLGGIHGSEPTSAAVASRLIDELRARSRLVRRQTIAILPAANPDGLQRRTRTNSRGVDLNRNFPATNWRRGPRGRNHGGAAPSSEPETRAILRAFEMLSPALVISIHATHSDRHCNNYDGPAEAIARQMTALNGYPTRASMGYPTPGSLGSWAGKDRGLPVITLELPIHASAEQCWQENRAALLAVLTAE